MIKGQELTKTSFPLCSPPGAVVCAADLRDKLAALFKRWARDAGCDKVFTDGPIDADEYLKESRRILFTLKEVNAPGEPWDLCDVLRSEDHWRTWNNVARWTLAVLNRTPWDDLPTLDKAERIKILSRIAVINLNKEGGAERTNPARLRTAAEKAKKLLCEQIDILDPHVVVCGGSQTADLLGEFCGGWRPENWTKVRPGVWIAPLIARRTVIAMPHPQARRSAQTMSEGLLAALAFRPEISELCERAGPDW